MRTLIQTLFVICSLVIVSCSSLKLTESASTATIAISAASSRLGANGSGLAIEVTNVKTEEKLRTIPLGKLSNHSVLLNVSPGTYMVTGIELPIGNLTFKRYDKAVSDYFGPIQVKEGGRYYLGFYSGRQKIGLNNTVSIELTESQIPEKLQRKLSESDKASSSRKFEVLRPVSIEPLIVY